MRQVGQWPFPSPQNVPECDQWQPVIKRVALNRDVLVVAKTRIEGKWAAYIGAVPGRNHDDEEAEVLRQGAKLLEQIARILFPDFEGVPYAR